MKLSTATAKAKAGLGWMIYKYRPRFADWRFWAVQSLIIVIAGVHTGFETAGYLEQLGRLYFVPISLLVVPVAYAALNFGFVGSITTALWVIVISIPNVVLWHHGLERVGEIFQLSILLAIAIFMGQRVDRETTARHVAEAANAALKSSEMKYRGLFDSSPVAIILLDKNGIILDANPAANALLSKTPDALKTTTLTDLIIRSEQRPTGSSPKGNWWETPLVIRLKDGSEVYMEPTHTQVSDSQGDVITQVLLRDVTQERQRQAGLKAYTAHVLRAQEEERQRIARELHDETIQTLALLCRRLDNVDSASGTLPTAAADELKQARKTAEEVVKELRDFTRALRPPILDDLGMVASIRRLLVDSMERAKIKGELTVVGEEQRLPRDMETGMFRMAQEALWNVERHSKATNVVVTITFAKHEAQLQVSDDGIGFTVPPILGGLSANGRLGLLGMQERAESLSGKLEIVSSPGKGTTLTISLPVPEALSKEGLLVSQQD